jgi:hypothetical protein
MEQIGTWEEQLNDFDREARRAALQRLAVAAREGSITLHAERRAVNLHGHTFFSYNAYGYSPSRFAWEARKAGLWMVQTVDFDVLDAMEEIFEAGDLLGMRAAAGLETRVFVEEYAEHELNSPGEPGISYFMGSGFVRPPQSELGRTVLERMARGAEQRNRRMLETLNDFLGEITLDYDADVLPLTPSGNATERHMLAAFETKSRAVFGERAEAAAAFWAEKTGVPMEQMEQFLRDSNAFRDTLRSKLMKRGGVAYQAPGRETFPPVEDVITMARSAEALPTITWLDGTSSGEADPGPMVDCLLSKGCEVLNIVPDRNWNITDPIEKEEKSANLQAIVAVCRDRHLPIVVGTEMNKAGQKFVDTFQAPELAPVVEDFCAGAEFLYGHTLLDRAAGHGRISAWAEAHFADRAAAVNFYRELGRAAPPPARAVEALAALPADHTPDQALAAVR